MGTFLYSGVIALPSSAEQKATLVSLCDKKWKSKASESMVGSYLCSRQEPGVFFLTDIGSKMGWEMRQKAQSFEERFLKTCHSHKIAAHPLRLGGDDDYFTLHSQWTQNPPAEAPIMRIIFLASGMFYNDINPQKMLELPSGRSQAEHVLEHTPGLSSFFQSLGSLLPHFDFKVGMPLANALCNALGVLQKKDTPLTPLECHQFCAAAHQYFAVNDIFTNPLQSYPYNWFAIAQTQDGTLMPLAHALPYEERKESIVHAHSVIEKMQLESSLPLPPSRKRNTL